MFGEYLVTELAAAKQSHVPGSCAGCGDTISRPLEGGVGRLGVGVIRGAVIGAVVVVVVGVVGWP